MSNLSSIQLQARALDELSRAAEVVSAGHPEAADRLTKEAHIKALLSIGAALRELGDAVRARD